MSKFYRPDLDALRGVAVLSVLFYHAKFSVLDKDLFIGGFLGVDIFFVLTGFLITSMLVIEFRENNSINISYFYLRRIKRLVPALLIVITLATFFSYFFLDPVKIKEFSHSVFYSLVFLPNFYFHYFGNFYGGDNNLYKPLLHLWSLGIEEQFYIFYPLFLIITFKYFKKFIKFFLFVGFIVSFAFAEYASNNHAMFSFYMLPSRAWEIILGALLAIYLLEKKLSFSLSSFQKNLIYFVSIILIFYFIFSYDIYNHKHPSSSTSIPLLAVSTLIVLGTNSQKLFSYKILTNRFLIFFGKISYSLYLYHFIIFCFYRNSNFEENTIVKIILILVSILVSYFSYLYIEQVFRKKSFSVTKLSSFIFIFLILIISTNSYFSLNKNLLEKDYIIDGVNITEWHDTEKIRKDFSKINKSSFLNNKKINVLISGNCHSVETYLSLQLNQDKFKDYNFLQEPFDIYKFEDMINSKNQNYIDSNIVILSTRWEDDNTKKNFDKLESLIKRIKNDKKRLIILSNFPEFEYKEHNFKLRNIELTNYKKKLVSTKSTDISVEEIYELKRKYYLDYQNNLRLIKINKKLQDISKKNKVEFIEMSKFTCDHKRKLCDFRLESSKDEIFRDYGRYSYNGLIFMGQVMFENDFLLK